MPKTEDPTPEVEFDGRPAPLEGCRCAACRWTRQNADLEANYAKYQAGLLVARAEME